MERVKNDMNDIQHTVIIIISKALTTYPSVSFKVSQGNCETFDKIK
jgi:hypothetical protein